MDEDFDIKHALHRHVTRHEPPSALTADRLLAAGRRRGRWRLSMTYGAASLATVVTVTGALTAFGSGGGQVTTLDDPCRLPLATATPIWPTATPTGWPGHSPSPWHSPTGSPHATATPGGPTPTATPGGPTPTATPGGPTPTATPGGPTPTAGHASPKAAIATCFLADELSSLLPDAKFLGVNAMAPMEFYVAPGGEPYVRLYAADGRVVLPQGSHVMSIFIGRQELVEGPGDGWVVREEGGKTFRRRVHPEGMAEVEVYTGHSTVMITVHGSVLTVEQLERLAAAPQLDVFRP